MMPGFVSGKLINFLYFKNENDKKVLLLGEIHNATSIEQFKKLFPEIPKDWRLFLELPADLSKSHASVFKNIYLLTHLYDKYPDISILGEKASNEPVIQFSFSLDDLLKKNVFVEQWIAEFYERIGDLSLLSEDLSTAVDNECTERILFALKNTGMKMYKKNDLESANNLLQIIASTFDTESIKAALRFTPNGMKARDLHILDQLNKQTHNVIGVLGGLHVVALSKIIGKTTDILFGEIAEDEKELKRLYEKLFLE